MFCQNSFKEQTVQVACWLMTIGLTLIILQGCGASEAETVPAPSSHQGHYVIQPKKEVRFVFNNYARSLIKPTHNPGDAAKKEKFLIKPTVWYSTSEGLFEYRFKGFQKSDLFDEPLAHFTYSLKNFKFKEMSKIQDGHTWSESYGYDGVDVKMLRNNEEVDGKNEMIGNPLEWYVTQDSHASFLPDGRPARFDQNVFQCQQPSCKKVIKTGLGSAQPKKCDTCGVAVKKVKNHGALFNKASYHGGTASMGQYFFTGIRIEELAHRVGFMTPMLKKTGQKVQKWTMPMIKRVVAKKNDQAVLEQWAYLGEEEKNGRKVHVVQFTARQVVHDGKMVHNGETIQGWAYDIKGVAELELETFVPWSVRINEDISWVDFVPYNRSGQSARHQMVVHQFNNIVTFDRQT